MIRYAPDGGDLRPASNVVPEAAEVSAGDPAVWTLRRHLA